MKLFSWNVNGIRAVYRHGFLPWFRGQNADVVCIQEAKAKPEQLPEDLRHPRGYHSFWHCAEKPGYSGVAVFCRREPLRVGYGMGSELIDREGRVLWVEFPDFMLINAYFPHARRDLSRLDFKLQFCREFLIWLETRQAVGKPVIVCGDYNISHADIDLANPRGNRKNAGFLPVERSWMDDFLERGFHDVFREAHPGQAGFYTWWCYRKGVRERNVGWRIDYHCVGSGLLDRVASVGHQPEQRGSDHCPIQLDLKF